MMPKSDTIDAIVRLNPGADPCFLAEFSSRELARYLERLSSTSRCRGERNPPADRFTTNRIERTDPATGKASLLVGRPDYQAGVENPHHVM